MYKTGIAQGPEDLRTAICDAAKTVGWTVEKITQNEGYYNTLTDQFSFGQDIIFYFYLSRYHPYGNDDYPNDVPLFKPKGINLSQERGLFFHRGRQKRITRPEYPCSWVIVTDKNTVFFWCEAQPAKWIWLIFGVSELPGTPKGVPFFGASGMYVPDQSAYDWNQSPIPIFLLRSPWGKEAFTQYKEDDWCESERFITNHGYLQQASVPEWSSEPVLLPLRLWCNRPHDKITLVADLENIRLAKLAHNAPCDIIRLGDDKWQLFPWHCRYLKYDDTIDKDAEYGVALKMN